jgi:hypothetical protein
MIAGKPTQVQLTWLVRGLQQPGGKLPLFDEAGQTVDRRTVESCLANGWAEPWFANPLKPDWRVCRLTEAGRQIAATLPARQKQDVPSGPSPGAPVVPIRR